MELARDLTPPRPGPKMEFLTARNTQPQSFICISRRIWAHHVHWIGERTAACKLAVGLDGQVTTKCEHCSAQRPVRWRGYLHMVPYGGQTDLFLCLTPGAGWELLQELGKEYDLRGLRMEVFRTGKAATSLLKVRVLAQYDRVELEREELDPGPYLETVFRKNRPLSLPT